jgi:hypothetical protein
VTTTDPRPDDTALRDIAHGVLDVNRHLVLGTIEQDGRPRVSPVYFTHDDYRRLYWVSSPASTHSGNGAADSRVALVVFDSSRRRRRRRRSQSPGVGVGHRPPGDRPDRLTAPSG